MGISPGHLGRGYMHKCPTESPQIRHLDTWDTWDTLNSQKQKAAPELSTMKRRRPPPVVVIAKPTRRSALTPAEPRRTPPDNQIRAWHADDSERQERERFERKPRLEQMQEAIAAWVYRFRYANDPDVVQRIARQGVARDLTEAASSHFRIIEGGDTPHIALYPRKGHWGLMKQGFAMLFPGAKTVVTDRKGPPAKFNLWAYIRSLKGD